MTKINDWNNKLLTNGTKNGVPISLKEIVINRFFLMSSEDVNRVISQIDSSLLIDIFKFLFYDMLVSEKNHKNSSLGFQEDLIVLRRYMAGQKVVLEGQELLVSFLEKGMKSLTINAMVAENIVKVLEKRNHGHLLNIYSEKQKEKIKTSKMFESQIIWSDRPYTSVCCLENGFFAFNKFFLSKESTKENAESYFKIYLKQIDNVVLRVKDRHMYIKFTDSLIETLKYVDKLSENLGKDALSVVNNGVEKINKFIVEEKISIGVLSLIEEIEKINKAMPNVLKNYPALYFYVKPKENLPLVKKTYMSYNVEMSYDDIIKYFFNKNKKININQVEIYLEKITEVLKEGIDIKILNEKRSFTLSLSTNINENVQILEKIANDIVFLLFEDDNILIDAPKKEKLKFSEKIEKIIIENSVEKVQKKTTKIKF